MDNGRDSLIDFESFWFNLYIYKPMAGLSYVIGKLTFEEAFYHYFSYIIQDLELFCRDNWFGPNMSPIVGKQHPSNHFEQ